MSLAARSQLSHSTLSRDTAASRFRVTARGKEVIEQEAAALKTLAASIDEAFVSAVGLLIEMKGSLIVIGVGKAGWIGQKLTASFASTGTPSHFVHPSEAIHGDLGRIQSADIVLILSNSGTTEEITRLLPSLRDQSRAIIAITSNADSPLADQSDHTLLLPKLPEACSRGLAPTTSTTCMLALGDALAMAVSDERGFRASDFAKFHPGGALGQKLKIVDEVMRPIDLCRVSRCDASIREVLIHVARPGRRTGAVMLTGNDGTLQGIFTDSDLAKLLEQRLEASLDAPISESMIRSFTAIQSGALASDAVMILAERKISELPVVDSEDRPVGLIDVTDLISYLDNRQKNISLTRLQSSSDRTDDAITLEQETNFPATIRLFR